LCNRIGGPCLANDYDELEWSARQYEVATKYLMDVLSKYEEIPNRIALPLMELADAINEEWEQFE
jgi:hypothetical protein